MPWSLGAFTYNTGVTEMLYKGSEVWPDVFTSNLSKGFVLTEVSRKDVIVFVLKDFKAEVVSFRNIYTIITPK